MKPPTIAHTWLKLDAGNHTQPIVALAASADGATVVSAAECTLRVWDAKTQKPLHQILGHTTPRVEGGDFAFTIDGMALTPDGGVVVTVKSGCRIEVFNVGTGNLLTAFQLADGLDVHSMAFSPDGKWFALGITRLHGINKNRAAVQVFATSALIRAGFDRAPEPEAALHLAQTRRIDEVMHLSAVVRWIPAPLADLPWRAAKTSGRRLQPRGYGLVVALHSLSDPGQRRLRWLAFRPGQGLQPMHSIEPERAISPETLAVSALAVVVGTEDDSVDTGTEHPLGRLIAFDHRARPLGHVVVEQAPVAAVFSPDGKQLAVGLDLAAQAEGEHLVLTHVIAAGPYGFERRSTYYGHDLPAKALAWRNADTVVSAGGDNNAIHFWSPATRVGLAQGALRGLGQDLLDAGIDAEGQIRFGTIPKRMQPPNHAARQQRFDLSDLRLHTASPSEHNHDERWNEKWALGGAGLQVLQIYHRPDIEGWEPQLFRPGHLTLFVGADDCWVLWTRSGYYATNAPEASRIGFCIDRGPHREALYLPADRFRAFAREDIVRAVIEHGSEERARAAGVDIPAVDVVALMPPVVEIERIVVAKDHGEVHITFDLEPPWAGQPTTRLWILRNDRFVWFKDEARKLRRRRWRVTLRLNPGRNVFAIRAECATAKSVPCTFGVDGPPRGPADVRLEAGRGKLFMLSVGVGNFKAAGTPMAGGTEPLSYPRRDATALYNVLAGGRHSTRFDPRMKKRNGAFDSVEATLLVDEQATKHNILAEVERFADEIVQRERKARAERDVLLVFLSGHGTRFAGDAELYFWNWDLELVSEELARTGLAIAEFANIATAVPAEVVLIVDACHSGMAGNNLVRGLDPQELAERMRAIHERGLYVINAARSEQIAFESDLVRHGVLTKALLEALRERSQGREADRGVGMLALMAEVQARVPRILLRSEINKPQTPVCRAYGDLLPLTIFKPPRMRRASPGLPRAQPSANVVPPPGTTTRARTRTMATKTAAAKKAPAKKVAPAKKAAAKKPAPAKTPARAKTGGKGKVTVIEVRKPNP